MIGIVQYGCGNVRSLEHGLEALGLESRRIATAQDLDGVTQLVLPGVGHFGHAMANLKASGMDETLRRWVREGRPLLGICLGMQLLFSASAEAPGVPGLGLLEGLLQPMEGPGLKVPHMGWSWLQREGCRTAVYYVHSYALRSWQGPAAPEWLGWSQYGGPFIGCFRSGALAGFQFHPEKSGPEGLRLLKEALSWS